MLIAYTAEKELINASETQGGQRYYCPDCGERLVRKAGKIKIPHFAHNQKGRCQGLSEGETAEHLRLKQLFYTWGNQSEGNWRMEAPLADLPQRPDLLHKRLAVEIQCSSLRSARLAERIRGYQQKDYQDWWLLGKRLWPKVKFTPLQRQFCSFDKTRGVHLWLLEADHLRLLYHIHELDHCVYYEQRWASYSLPLTEIFQTTVTKPPPQLLLTSESIQLSKQVLSQKLVQKNQSIHRMQQYFYQERRHVLYLPEWMYFPSRYRFFYQDDILVFRYMFQKFAKNASLIFQNFLNYRQASQLEWIFDRIDQREILERLYLEAIFCQRKAKNFI